MARITFLGLEKWEEKYVSSKLKKHKLIFEESNLNQHNISKIKHTEILSVFVHSEINPETINRLKKLKFINTMSTGYDHIDQKMCSQIGIPISNVPLYGENTVAEFTFALILELSRKTRLAINKTKKDDFTISELEGFDLKNKTLGVIGPGEIGQNVIKIANGFGMKVIANGRKKDKKLEDKLNFRFTSLENLLKKSDIITLHVPLNEKTRHMINSQNIKKIKPGAFLINTSRGAVIETKAILYALDKKILGGAALDVLEGEENLSNERHLLKKDFKNKEEWKEFIQNHLLLKEKNAIVTPHCAFNTKEAKQRILDTSIKNIKAFLKGKPINRIC